MKLLISLPACVALLVSQVVAQQQQHPCAKYPAKVTKLQQCSTASAFCQKFIGTASFTKTFTAYSTSDAGVSTETIAPTSVSYTGVTTETATTSTLLTDTSTTTTITSSSCPSPAKLRRADVTPPAKIFARGPKASCGFAKTADAGQISGACNCIIASSTTTTITTTTYDGTTQVTDGPTSIIETVSTFTTTPSTTIYTKTSTSTVCATPAPTLFTVHTADSPPKYVQLSYNATTDTSYLLIGTSNIPSVFMLTPEGYLQSVDTGLLAYLGTTSDETGYAYEIGFPANGVDPYGYGPLNCFLQIPKYGYTFGCSNTETGANSPRNPCSLDPVRATHIFLGLGNAYADSGYKCRPLSTFQYTIYTG